MKSNWLLLFLIVFLLSSCISQKKKENLAYGYFRENPAKLAEICADQFPVKETITPGKTIHTSDTTYLPGKEIPCPEPTTDPLSGKTKPGTVTCPPAQIIDNSTHTRDTLTVENTARVDELRLKLYAESVQRRLAEDDLKEAEEQVKADRKYKWAAGFLTILLACSIIKRFLP